MAEFLPPVTQKFEGDASGAIAEAEKVKAELRSVEDQSAKSSKSIAGDSEKVTKGFEDAGAAAKKGGKDTEDSFKTSGKASTDFERLVTSNLKDGETAFESMQRSIDETKTKIVDLKSKFAATGDSSAFGDIRKSEADLKTLTGYVAKMTPEFTQTNHEVSDFDRLVTAAARDGESAFMSISRAIVDTKSKITDLRKSFATTGSQSTFGDLKKSEADLKTLTHFAESMAPGIAKAGEDAGSGFISSMVGAIGDNSSVGTAIKVAVVGGVLAASPAIISVLGAALETGIGGAGIAAGIYEAAKDPRVKAAASGLKSEIGGELSSAAQVFIGPTLEGIALIKADFADIGPGLKSTFKALAADVEPLASGLSQAANNFLPGMEAGLKGASPLLHELANDLPRLGRQVGEMFADFGKGGPGAVLALKNILAVLGDVAVGLGKVYDWSTNTFLSMEQEMVHVENGAGGLLSVLGEVSGFGAFKALGSQLHDLANGQQGAIDSAKAGAAATDDFSASQSSAASATHKTVQTLDQLIAANNKWISAAEGSDNATLQFHEDLTAFNKQLKDGKHAWDINTAAGQANVASLNQVTDSLTALNPTTLKGMEAEKKYAEKLLATASANGATSKETRTLRGVIQGLTSDIAKVKSKKVTIAINEKYTTHFINEGTSPSQFAHGLALGGVVHAASGLVSGILPPRSPGTLVLAGEQRTGGEVFAPLRGIPQERAMKLAQVIGDSYNFDVVSRSQRAAMVVGSGGGGGGVVNVTIPVVLGGHTLATVSRSLVASTQQAKQRGTVSGFA